MDSDLTPRTDTTPSTPRCLLLLLTEDAGRQHGTQIRMQSLNAAVVTDLVIAGRVDLEGSRDPRLHVTDPSPTGDEVLDAALGILAAHDGTKLSRLVQRRDLDPTERIGDELAAAGVLERKDGLLGTRWPTLDPRPEQELRSRLAAILRGELEASAQDAAVLAIIKAQRAASRVLGRDVPELKGRQLDRRIDEVSRDVPTAEAVKKAYDMMMTAVTTAAIVPTIVSS